jgi:uncharacterized cupredoxin-like copper-binding protein
MRRLALLLVISGLSFATACGPAPATSTPAGSTQPATSAHGTEVVVTLADNTIESSLTSFQVGVPYTFVITNTGRHAHNFNIAQPVSVAGSLDAALQGALLAVSQRDLGPGATVSVPFTFPDSAADLKLEFSCLIRRHYEDGMLLMIMVVR